MLLCICLTGCSSQSMTFDVSTNDCIKVTLSDYDLKTDHDNFLVYDQNNQKIAEGIFIPEETYKSLLKEKEQLIILEDSKKDSNPYFLCKNNKEYVYVLFLEHSHTGIFLTCFSSRSKAKNIFESLSFKIVENS